MISSSSLATLIVASQLSLDPCTGTAAEGFFDCLDDVDGTSPMDKRKVVDNMLQGASIALAIAFSMAADLPPMRMEVASGPVATSDTSDYNVVENDNVKALWSQRPRLSRRTKLSNLFQTAEKWEEVPVLQGCDDGQGSLSSAGTPVKQLPKISTRRQRRASDKSRANYSDFCDNDLSRQIEAMVMEAETAHENRRAKKSNHVIAQSLIKTPVKNEKSIEMKVEKLSTPAKEPLHFDLVRSNTTKSICLSPIPHSSEPLQLLRNAFQTPTKKNDHVPEMTPCDSLASMASDYSFDSRSSFGSFSPTPQKKSWNFSAQRNAEWSILE